MGQRGDGWCLLSASYYMRRGILGVYQRPSSEIEEAGTGSSGTWYDENSSCQQPEVLVPAFISDDDEGLWQRLKRQQK